MAEGDRDSEETAAQITWSAADQTGYGKTKSLLERLGHLKSEDEPERPTPIAVAHLTSHEQETYGDEVAALLEKLNSSAGVDAKPATNVVIDPNNPRHQTLQSYKGTKVKKGRNG